MPEDAQVHSAEMLLDEDEIETTGRHARVAMPPQAMATPASQGSSVEAVVVTRIADAQKPGAETESKAADTVQKQSPVATAPAVPETPATEALTVQTSTPDVGLEATRIVQKPQAAAVAATTKAPVAVVRPPHRPQAGAPVSANNTSLTDAPTLHTPPSVSAPEVTRVVQKSQSPVSAVTKVPATDIPTMPVPAAVAVNKTPIATNNKTPSEVSVIQAPVQEVARPVQRPQPVPARPKAPARASSLPKQEAANAHALRERCRQLCLSIFFQSTTSVRSLGFTSAISGEGKSFLAAVTASVLADDSADPVTLLDCNWDHPVLHEQFGCPLTPGLAEWMRGECDESAIRHRVGHNLTLIPAGDGLQDAVRLLHQMRQYGLQNLLSQSNELVIVDMPSVLTTAYGTLAASIAEALIVVVRAGVTPETMIGEACEQLKGMPVHGMILNEVASRIPRWIRQIL